MADDTAPAGTEEAVDTSKDDEEILEEARERFTSAESDDKENRDAQLEDTKFVYVPGAQWSSDVKAMRKDWNEPCLEFNDLPQFVNEVVNDARQNRPSIKVHPASGQASKETAEIIQGLVRGIEYDSKAEAVYDNGIQGGVVGGRGWWYVDAEWVPMTMFQKIVIKPVLDAYMVRADLNYQQPDGSDRNWAFIVESIGKTDFKQRWPKAQPTSFEDAEDAWKNGKDLIYIAKYYRRKCTYRTLVMMSDGAIGWKDEMPEALPEGVREMRSREAEVYTVEWFTVAGGNQILERGTWPGEIIPVICVPGEDMLIDGRRIYNGLIRRMRDSATMFNYGMTAQAISLALTPRAPWVAPQEAIEDYQKIWKDLNNTSISVAPYKHRDAQGLEIPAPKRTERSLVDAGWVNWGAQMQALKKSTAGIYENSLGQKSQETSRVAIVAKEKQGDKATFHYLDNQNRAIALTGKVIVPAIPVYYDTDRIEHIVGPDDVRKMVRLNQAGFDGAMKAIKLNDVTSGEYAVTVDTGPGYTTARQEAATIMTELAQNAGDPAQSAVLKYVALKNAEFYGSDEALELVATTLPAPAQAIIAAKKDGGKAPDPALQQAQQKLQMADAAIKEAHDKIQELEAGQQTEMAKVQAKAAADHASVEATKEAELAKVAAEAEVERARIAMLGEKQTAELELARRTAHEKAALARWEAEEAVKLKREVADAEIALDRERAAAAHAVAMTAAQNKPKPNGKGASA